LSHIRPGLIRGSTCAPTGLNLRSQLHRLHDRRKSSTILAFSRPNGHRRISLGIPTT
jgi:hypothetical protein